MQEYSNIEELNTHIKTNIEQNFQYIKVSGELSNVKISNKNLFASLRDINSSINVCFWGFSNKFYKPINNGDQVNIIGKLVVYNKNGTYSINISKLELSEINKKQDSIYTKYEETKKKYELLGYFNNKKQIPNNIKTIGILTSMEGAALQDILYVLNKSNYNGRVLLQNCLVQGVNSVQSVLDGLAILLHHKLDCIIIARGGGSYEDLISFSDAKIIEAIYNSKIFTISAIGHEVDFMLSDFVADYRAPTPSIAGEFVSSIEKKNLEMYNSLKYNITNNLKNKIISNLDKLTNKINILNKNIIKPDTKLDNARTYLDTIKQKYLTNITNNITSIKNKLDKLNIKLAKHDILNMLDNGYVVLTKNNSIIDSIHDIKHGQKLKLKMKDGEVNVIIEKL